jgi:hypothetical protein
MMRPSSSPGQAGYRPSALLLLSDLSRAMSGAVNRESPAARNGKQFRLDSSSLRMLTPVRIVFP